MAAPSPQSPTMPGTLAVEVQRAELSAASALTSLPSSVSRRAPSEIVPGLSYSQVVSRPASPESGTPQKLFEPTSISEGRAMGSAQLERNPDQSDVFGTKIDNIYSTNNVVKAEDGPWTTVSYKRGRSYSLPTMEPETDVSRSSSPTQHGISVNDISMTKNQQEAIAQAENGLTTSEAGRIQQRMDQVREFNASKIKNEEHLNFEQGNSQGKGKTVDPHNWGAANLPEKEMDVEAQRKELERYADEKAAKEQMDDEPALSIEQQRELLAFWKAHHQARCETVNDTSHHSVKEVNESEEAELPQPVKAESPKPETNLPPKIDQKEKSVQVLEGLPVSESKEAESKEKKSKRSRRKDTQSSSDSESEPIDAGLALVDDSIRKKSKSRKKDSKTHRRKERHDSLAPSSQIEEKSYLGQILSKKGKKRRSKGSPDPSDSSSSSSDSSKDNDSGSDSYSGGYSSDSSSNEQSVESSDNSEDEVSDASSLMSRRRRHKNHRGGRSRSRSSRRKDRYRKRQKSRRRHKLPRPKPEKPEKYNGTPDPEKFHKFGRQCKEYLDGYDIKCTEIVIKLSHFLEGKAYNFYANTVSDAPHKWNLRRFLKGLFDYCFPVAFRAQQRQKLNQFKQRELTVQDFQHELRNLFRMVGVVSKQDRIDRLWYGLNAPIRQKLWEHGLSSTTSKWRHIVKRAIHMEMSINSENARSNNRPTPPPRTIPVERTGPHNNQGSRHPRDRRNFHRKPNTESSNQPSSAGSSQRNHLQGIQRNQPRNTAQPRQMSEKEKADLKAAGKCFVCKESGHMARNCPQNNRVKSNNRNKPPGISAYSVRLQGSNTEELRSLAQSTTPGLHLASAEFNWETLPTFANSDHEWDDMPELQEVPTSDEESDWSSYDSDSDTESEDTETVSERSDSEDGLPDLQDCSDSETDIEGLDDRDFDIMEELPGEYCDCQWPFREHAQGHQALALERLQENRTYLPIGDLIAKRATELLNQYAPYVLPLGQKTFGTFVVFRISDKQHVIMSGDDNIEVAIDTDLLENVELDLPLWFQHRLLPPSYEPAGKEKSPFHPTEDMMEFWIQYALEALREHLGVPGFDIRFKGDREYGQVALYDNLFKFSIGFPEEFLRNPHFDLVNNYARTFQRAELAATWFDIDDLDGELQWWIPDDDLITRINAGEFDQNTNNTVTDNEDLIIQLNAAEPTYSALHRTAAVTRDFRRLIPEPIVVVVDVNGQPARALLDSGSLTDFISAKFVRQLKATTFELEKPVPVQLAVQGSRAKITTGCTVQLRYQDISEERYMDVSNLENYDVILGTPFLFQHKVCLGLNPTSVLVGSIPALPIEGKRVRVLESRAADVFEDRLDAARKELREYAKPICKEACDSPLPPLRAINHTIPLIDPDKVYPWRPSRCPDAHRASWAEKRRAYEKSGRWKFTTAQNTCPMLLLTKPGTGKNGIPAALRSVVDSRDRNKNTVKLTSPLPDMDGILRRVAQKPYRSLADGKDAYEQIRVEPEHVERTAMTTPDGNMVSLVMQQGDCNAVATYQSLMNHIFAPYLGVFMDVYLDDIIIYSDTLEDHVKHVKTVIDVLKKEELYLSSTKLRFLEREMKILGRIVDDNGIRMDPDKVDSVLNWKVPTSKELLRGFLGSVGYLADDIATVRVPMGVLTPLTGSTSSFHWEFTHQRCRWTIPLAPPEFGW
ncbi:hypothetical protein NLI96_g11283 [Meripilus lineatus]|uniref:Reverse transcriptase n=1 Tax=Meripilus lineatus TaxID=2056292 RepID=A0AAD5UW94_9APHY|nr:hypothetical protein NLI96_g11283 [Physisporinus lineatus]